MMEYNVIKRDTYFEIIDAMTTYIKLGWRPQGGIAVTEETMMGGAKRLIYIQAIVKEK